MKNAQKAMQGTKTTPHSHQVPQMAEADEGPQETLPQSRNISHHTCWQVSNL